jgi:hypothetical protein
MADNYLWSDLRTAGDDGKVTTVKAGSKVTEAQVGGKDEFKRLQDEGVIRSYAMPDMGSQSGMQSPVVWMRAEVAKRGEADTEEALSMLLNAENHAPEELAGTTRELSRA